MLNKGKTVPLLWQVLGNKYKDQLEFGSHRDRKGKTGKALGVGMGGKKESRVLVYPAGSTSPVVFEGAPAAPHVRHAFARPHASSSPPLPLQVF